MPKIHYMDNSTVPATQYTLQELLGHENPCHENPCHETWKNAVFVHLLMPEEVWDFGTY